MFLFNTNLNIFSFLVKIQLVLLVVNINNGIQRTHYSFPLGYGRGKVGGGGPNYEPLRCIIIVGSLNLK